MSPLALKIGLSLVGIATFLYGVRAENAAVRWLGIGFVAVAFALRFVGPKPPPRRGPRG